VEFARIGLGLFEIGLGLELWGGFNEHEANAAVALAVSGHVLDALHFLLNKGISLHQPHVYV
jgi:hypothetical protein